MSDTLSKVRRVLIDVFNETHALPPMTSHRPIQERAEIAIMAIIEDAISTRPAPTGEVGGVPEGWVLVPREPTPTMQIDGVKLYEAAGGRGYSALALCDGIYRAMIAAAPSSREA